MLVGYPIKPNHIFKNEELTVAPRGFVTEPPEPQCYLYRPVLFLGGTHTHRIMQLVRKP